MISVSDTGDGIPDAIRDRVFDPFFTTKESATAPARVWHSRARRSWIATARQ